MPYVLLTILVLTWVVLAATAPAAVNRQLTVDVTCTSGNPAVGAWIESSTGGSWWAEKGEPGTSTARRFVFTQVFEGSYRVDVGCGGTEGQWGVPASSADSSAPYRKLACDDLNVTVTDTVRSRCHDQ
ncbi:hypothetical protein ADL03_02050 [Nocardia sp. NRRL S-836]|nr:hypothetical protein ADL03_02050 [Nocardia sp. NRRL S-836]